MGFLGKMVAKAVVKKAETAAIYGVVSHMENTRSVDALVNKSTANYMLFIKKKVCPSSADSPSTMNLITKNTL